MSDVGRPTKLTAEMWKQLVDDVRRGIPQYRAAQRAGIFPDTVSKWKANDPAFKLAIDQALAEFGEEVDGGIYSIAFDVEHPKRFDALCRIKDTRFANESPRVKKLVAEALEVQEILVAKAIASLDPETQLKITGAMRDARESTLTGEPHRAAKPAGPADRAGSSSH